jgi:hypothetical protein
MIPFIYHWPIAFLITQLIEIPIYLWMLQGQHQALSLTMPKQALLAQINQSNDSQAQQDLTSISATVNQLMINAQSVFSFQRLILVCTASALTHPFIFLYLPLPCQHYQLSQSSYILLAELFAIAGESLYFKLLGVKQAWRFVLLANIMSASIGTAFFRYLIFKDSYVF